MNSASIFRAFALVGLAAAILPALAHAQRIGADIGYAYLLDSKARAAFGSGVIDYGIRFGRITPSPEGRIGLDFSVLRPRKTDNSVRSDALIITVGPEYRKAYIPGNIRRVIAQQQQQQQLPPEAFPPGTKTPQGFGGPPPFLPYYGASANLIYAQVKAPLQGVNGNGFGVGGSVFAGVTFNDRFYIEGRVRATTKIKGYNFSRAGVTVGVRF